MPIRALHLVRQLAAEYKSLEALRRLQLDKLRTLIEESYRQTTMYRCLMQRAGVRPEDMRNLEDLERLPIVCKDDLREFSEPERTNQARASRYHTTRLATSGSSGNPFEFLVDRPYDKWRKSQYLRPYVTNGRRPWHSTLRLTAYPRSKQVATSPFNPFRERQIACTAPVADQVAEVRNMRPAFIQGYPSALRCLAFELAAEKVSTPHVRKVFTDSELLTPDSRRIIENAFDAPVIDVFGSYETDNIAYQCGHGNDYHVAIDSAVVEVVQNGASVINSEGELVVTVLDNLTMPFIRYNLKDVAELLSTPCSCGRTFPLLRIRKGRSDDLIVDADGRQRSPLSILWRFDAFSEFIREYQIAQTAIDEFTVRVVPQEPLTESVEDQIRSAITIDFPDKNVVIEPMTQLERSPAAKLKAFVSELSKHSHGD